MSAENERADVTVALFVAAGKSWRQRLMTVIDQLKSLQAGIKDPTGYMTIDGGKVATRLIEINAVLENLAREAATNQIKPVNGRD